MPTACSRTALPAEPVLGGAWALVGGCLGDGPPRLRPLGCTPGAAGGNPVHPCPMSPDRPPSGVLARRKQRSGSSAAAAQGGGGTFGRSFYKEGS